MKKYTAPSVEEIKIVSMDHITATGGAGGDGSGYGGGGRPGM